MNHSWRPPPLPPIPGSNTNICPICSISHFPFCPSPLPFIENPRFHHPQPHNDYYLQRPHLYHHHPFPNHQSSSNYYNYDARRPTWYACNPRLDMIPYDGIEENYSNHPRGGVASASYGYDGYDNGGIKRPKIEITDNNRAPRGTFTGGEVPDTARIPSDNERILKLIHDHGNVSSGHERLGETCEVRVDMGLKRKRETSEFSSVSMGSLNYSRYSNQLSPTADAMQHHLQPNHNSQPPYNWSESKGHYGGPVEVGHGYGGQPPLPASPPPPLPIDPPRNHFFDQIALPPTKKPSLFPVAIGSSADSAIHGNQSSAQVYHTNNSGRHGSTLSSAEEFHALQSSEKHVRDIQPFQLQTISSDKPNIIDATLIFKQPHRASRPDHLVIILRGLPGSGKSYLAKLLRDIEVENGGEAPRIHSMDEYFMTEVEKAEDSELSKSSGSLRGKRQVMKTVMEYCYEPEMEEAYRASMLKAFKKTLDEGVYSFIIVDDRNLRVADFAQFWATAKRSGYEVYLVEASYKDPAGCAARNVHNFTLDDIQKMAGQWEEAPSLYLKMDIKSLLHGDGFDESGIQEVDMDMEDEDAVDASQKSVTRSPQNDIKNQVDDFTPHDVGEVKDVKHPTGGVNHLSRSKWSNDLDASGTHKTEGGKEKKSLLAGLIQAYSKEGKSVSWGDQGGNVGFSISATRKTNTRSLVIGPGSGYNLKSNPLSEEEYLKPARNSVELKSQNVFQERIRAERESFKAVFDKRRQRIGGFNVDDE